MSRLDELKKALEEVNLLDRNIELETRYENAVGNERIREFMEFEDVPITDFTEIIDIQNGGKLYAVREDLNQGVDNHKKPVVGGLILRGVLQGRIPRERIDTLIDGGNFNSAKALRFYTELLGMNGMYVMSRLFPQHVVDMLETDNFQVKRAPKRYENAIEREFYEFLFEQMRDRDFRSNKHCLWHAKYSGKAMYPFGRQIAARLEDAPDYIVSCIGAGATLEGLQIPIQDHFIESCSQKRPVIIVGEHELSPLFVTLFPYDASPGSPPIVESMVGDIDPDYYERIDGLPHVVIGPHYDEINPLLAETSISRIDRIVQYSEHDWMVMQKYLHDRGISVGNSSAANLNVATSLANQGNDVLTVIFEPFREFYKRHEYIERLI